MSSEQLIPNAVGRLDDVVEAIRDGNLEKAITLCNQERMRLAEKCMKLKIEHRAARDSEREVHEFLREICTDGTVWRQARIDCGWKGQTE